MREKKKKRERENFEFRQREYRNFCYPKPTAWVWSVHAQMETNCGNIIAEIGKKKFVAIVAMALPKIGKKNMVAEIWEGVKKKCYVYNIFTIFLQQITGN